MYIRSFAYQALLSQLNSDDLLIYLPQLLQIIKFDYTHSSILIEYLLQQTINQSFVLAHKFYWYLRQLLITEHLHYIRYYYLFLSLLYVLEDNFRQELQREYDLCMNLRNLGLNFKKNKSNHKNTILLELLSGFNQISFNR